jgi:hypothetical protein
LLKISKKVGTLAKQKNTEDFSRLNEGYHQTIKDPKVLLEPQQLYRFCNKLTAFYWMASPQVDGRPLPMTPFSCIYKEWIRYHSGRPPD